MTSKTLSIVLNYVTIYRFFSFPWCYLTRCRWVYKENCGESTIYWERLSEGPISDLKWWKAKKIHGKQDYCLFLLLPMRGVQIGDRWMDGFGLRTQRPEFCGKVWQPREEKQQGMSNSWVLEENWGSKEGTQGYKQ